MNYPKADLIKYRLERAEEVLKEAEVMAKWNIGDRALIDFIMPISMQSMLFYYLTTYLLQNILE